jgi:hypothetical protein
VSKRKGGSETPDEGLRPNRRAGPCRSSSLSLQPGQTNVLALHLPSSSPRSLFVHTGYFLRYLSRSTRQDDAFHTNDVELDVGSAPLDALDVRPGTPHAPSPTSLQPRIPSPLVFLTQRNKSLYLLVNTRARLCASRSPQVSLEGPHTPLARESLVSSRSSSFRIPAPNTAAPPTLSSHIPSPRDPPSPARPQPTSSRTHSSLSLKASLSSRQPRGTRSWWL